MASRASHYDDARSQDDEIGYRLDSHRFIAGDYVSIRDDQGALLPFRIASVKVKGSPQIRSLTAMIFALDQCGAPGEIDHLQPS